jgi:hypothetical protein
LKLVDLRQCLALSALMILGDEVIGGDPDEPLERVRIAEHVDRVKLERIRDPSGGYEPVVDREGR